MVRGDDVGAARRQVLQPAHRERDGAQAQEQARKALSDAPCRAPGRDRGDEEQA